MFFIPYFRKAALCLLFSASTAWATGVVPETSVVIVEQADGEGTISLKNTDRYPVLLLTTLENIKDDSDNLLVVTPPAARVEPDKVQRVRFLLIDKTPLKTERLKRVVFEGIPPQKKNENEVRMTIRQNLPVIIRPAGLPREQEPWKLLIWSCKDGVLSVNNPSPYVVRLSQRVSTAPASSEWILPESYVLPGQTISLKRNSGKPAGEIRQITLYPATTWGFSVESYTTPVVAG